MPGQYTRESYLDEGLAVVLPLWYASAIALLTRLIERTDVSFAGIGYWTSEKSQSELERPMTGMPS